MEDSQRSAIESTATFMLVIVEEEGVGASWAPGQWTVRLITGLAGWLARRRLIIIKLIWATFAC